MLEMYSFILAKRYGHGYETARRILNCEPFAVLCSMPDFKSYIMTMPRSKDNLLYSIFEYLRFTLTQLYVNIMGEYAASSRRKSYLATASFIQKFKKKIVELDEKGAFKAQIQDWKETGRSFFESMPEIN